MNRLCERPGCSEPASVAYGMRPEDLVFWLDVLADGDVGRRVLCLRHADTMIVPRGWTLDDLRDPDLHLFRPPPLDDHASSRTARTRSAKRSAADEPPAEQLQLGAQAAPVSAPLSGPEPASLPAPEPGPEPAPASEPWTPSFDEADDLDGLLAARSPLLSRAFRGADRPRST